MNYSKLNLPVRAAALLMAIGAMMLGIGCKAYSGPAAEWVRNWGPANVAYEVMLIGGGLAVFPWRRSVMPVVVSVFVVTAVLELIQLWHPPFLEAMRATTVGKLALGTSFSLWDYPAYLVGCCTGYPLGVWITKAYKSKE